MKYSFIFFLGFILNLHVPTALGRTIHQNDRISQAEYLIQEARDEGIRYLNTENKRSKDTAKKNLKKAEQILNDLLKKDRDCMVCTENLVEAYFYQAYFKFVKNYNRCIETAEKGLDRFPESTRLVFFQGYAYYNSEQYADASKSLNYYMLLASGDPNAEEQVRQILDDAQHQFLNSWNKQSDFYNSKESKIFTYNQQTYQFQTIFQVTPNWELNTGNQAHRHLSSELAQVNDPDLQMYLDDLTHRLLSRTPGPYSNYKVTILDSPQINAVTPPGHIIIYTGLLRFVDTEAQLAGVLAHELAHNYGHHSAQRYIKAYHTTNLTNSIYKAIDPQGNWAQYGAQIGAQIVNDLFLKAHSRDKEKEADLYGAHILFNAGYNPTALSEFFLKLYKYNPKHPPKFLSTHPPSPDRVNYLTDYLESFPMDRETRVSSETFERIKRKYGSIQLKPTDAGRGIMPPSLSKK